MNEPPILQDAPSSRQRKRLITRLAFFAVFVLAPPLDLFRLDLTLGHFILFGHPWTLGLDPFVAGEAKPFEAIVNLLGRGFVPVIGGGALFLWIAWRFGRLYCGWLCPHFSVVELVNGLMRRAWGRPNLWERRALPELHPDGTTLPRSSRYWIPAAVVIVAMSLLWALTLLTYLLPPKLVYHNLLNGELTRNQAIFIGVGTAAFIVEFTLARHLFCRYACAVGLFQSLAWMANRRAMVVRFDSSQAKRCADCFSACDHACPMRLRPRTIKRKMFACTQCGQCLSACESVQARQEREPLLEWVQGAAACSALGEKTGPSSSRTVIGETRSTAESCGRGGYEDTAKGAV